MPPIDQNSPDYIAAQTLERVSMLVNEVKGLRGEVAKDREAAAGYREKYEERLRILEINEAKAYAVRTAQQEADKEASKAEKKGFMEGRAAAITLVGSVLLNLLTAGAEIFGAIHH